MRDLIRHGCRVIALGACALGLLPSTASPAAEEAVAKPQLNEDQGRFATRALDFMKQMDALYFSTVETLNGGLKTEERVFDNENGNYDVRVARGPVIEKAGRVLTITRKPTRKFEPPTLWSRFFNLDAHPKSPLVGTLHAALVVQFYPDGSSSIGGWLDVMPGAMRPADLQVLKSAMDKVYEAHGVDGAKHRAMACKGTGEKESPYRRRPACVGGSFYGRDMMSVTAENFAFMTEAYRTFLSTYLGLVGERRNDAYTDADLASQAAMRRNWLEDRFFADPFTTTVTPYDAWSLYSLPPTVTF